MTIGKNCQLQTGTHHIAVHEDRAGAAHADAATLFSTCEPEIVAQKVDQKTIGWNFGLDFLSVNAQFYLLIHRCSFLQLRWERIFVKAGNRRLGFLYRKKLAKLQAVLPLSWQKNLAASCGAEEIQSGALFTDIGSYANSMSEPYRWSALPILFSRTIFTYWTLHKFSVTGARSRRI